MSELLLTGLLQGLILAIIACGIMIPFRLLNFADLTAEGTYPLGGAMCATLLVLGTPPLLALAAAALASGVLGIATAFIYLRFKVNTLLAGIILSTMLYSINLRLMGSPNIPLFEQNTIFTIEDTATRVAVVLGILMTIAVPLFLFLRTEMGLRLRAVGLNSEFAARQTISPAHYIFMGLFLGNMCCGLAGGLMVQLQSYAEVGMGVGIVIHALAAMMIGESLLGKHTIQRQIAAPIVGALLYQQIQGLVLFLGLSPSDLKLLTGIIVIIVIAMRGKML